ncbi:prealbumin-like fold domain-containing protein [Agromyces albus]|uniref:SpaA-like prealbumin fold domain-containing protein n=1 Tax=Agromyces albus TaxID=205332 RepID=A0A4Q2KS47_9MICO|nr:hypothetical protein [Agromyces albus]RXZ68274.1 hypothetical protein ESP51_14465 [Agromyces albus]
MFSRRQRTALLAAGALVAGLFAPVAFAAPAYADPLCDLGDFEIDGNLTEQDCGDGFDDWLTPDIGFTSTEQGGTYSASSKDVDDPATWTSAGSTPDKADFSKVYTLARVVDGHYYLYVAWDRTGDSGTGKYAIDLSFAGENVAPDGTPQPLHNEGGVVAYINMAGGSAPTLGQLCPYVDQADYPDDVNSDPGDCTTDTTGFASAIGPSGTFFEVGFDLTELAGIEPGCPPTEDAATVYMRSITGGSGDGNLKAYVAPLTVTPPSTCGFLTVTKESLNDLDLDSSVLFEYTVTGGENDPIDGDLLIDETDSYFDVEPGDDFTLDEVIPAQVPWSLYSIVCTADGVDYVLYENGAATGTTFPVVSLETTDCVITNATSYVTVEKQTLPDASTQVFDFDIEGAAFDLSDGESETFQFAPGAEVDITETVPEGWDLVDVTCDTDETAIEDGATVTTIEGETASCVFTNEQQGAIVINKLVEGVNDAEFDFSSDALGDFSIETVNGFGTATFDNLVPGAYDVSEDLLTGYDTTNLVCVDPDDGTVVDLEDFSAAIDLDAGETVECTFTNTERGLIFVDKETLPNEFDQDFEFTFDGGEGPIDFTLNDATDDEEDFWNSGFIVPGTYTVDELVPAGWTLDGISCGVVDGDGTTIELGAGEVVSCVFTNEANPGSVTVKKSAVGGNGTFGFVLTELGSDGDPRTREVTTVSGSATAVFDLVDAGNRYSIEETKVTGSWTAGPMTCEVTPASGGAPVKIDPADFEVAPGDEIVCAITNTLRPPLAITGVDLASGMWLALLLLGAGGLVFMIRRRARTTGA